MDSNGHATHGRGRRVAGTSKPGIDWVEIEAAWRGGTSPSKLAKLHNVTRQAVELRRDRHGWVRDAEAQALGETTTAKRITEPETRHDRRLIADGKRTLTNMRTILQLLQDGGTRNVAAQRVGIAPNTLRAWLESDEEFARLAAAAEAEAAQRRIERIEAAGARGEWRADLALLERSPVTRDEFAPRLPEMPAMGGGVVLNIVFRERDLAERMARSANGGAGADGSGRIFVEAPDGTRQEVTVPHATDARPVLEHQPEAEPNG